jgi:hypothetical protein
MSFVSGQEKQHVRSAERKDRWRARFSPQAFRQTLYVHSSGFAGKVLINEHGCTRLEGFANLRPIEELVRVTATESDGTLNAVIWIKEDQVASVKCHAATGEPCFSMCMAVSKHFRKVNRASEQIGDSILAVRRSEYSCTVCFSQSNNMGSNRRNLPGLSRNARRRPSGLPSGSVSIQQTPSRMLLSARIARRSPYLR